MAGAAHEQWSSRWGFLLAAVGAFPGNPIAGHPPLIFIPTRLTHAESAPAVPAKIKRPCAAMAEF